MAIKDLKQSRLGLIGAGRFGRAFIQGLLKAKLFPEAQIWAAEHSSEARTLAEKTGVEVVEDFLPRISGTQILVLCVKPAQIEEVIKKLNVEALSKDCLVISVAAGTSISKMETLFGSEISIVRAMPNSPCSVQASFTAICGGTYAKLEHLEIARKIFETLGLCLEIPETHFDLVTALSGSGPAYFYLFMETMIEVATRAGISEGAAVTLASQTALGAARMVQETGRTPVELRKDVATPGGCTMAALKVLETSKVSEHFAEAILEAARVAAGLGQTQKK